MWYHIGKHHLYSGEWFLKIDDDTFFSAVNFRGFARYYNPDKTWYFGHTLLHIWRSKNIVFNSGTCYALSRGSLEKLVTIFNTEAFLNDPQRKHRGKQFCVHRAGAEEDPTVGLCLRSLGVQPTNSLDNEFRERFLPFRVEFVIKFLYYICSSVFIVFVFNFLTLCFWSTDQSSMYVVLKIMRATNKKNKCCVPCHHQIAWRSCKD